MFIPLFLLLLLAVVGRARYATGSRGERSENVHRFGRW
jgi:hypothetical protein